MKWINAHQDSIYCSAKSERPGAMIYLVQYIVFFPPRSIQVKSVGILQRGRLFNFGLPETDNSLMQKLSIVKDNR
jgi:hypothetical protein